MPEKEGFYWAMTEGHLTFNLIAYVYGHAPFFRVDVVNIKEEKYDKDVDPRKIQQFGPEIIKPTI